MTRLCVAIPEDIVHRRSHETTRVRWNIIKVCRHSIHCFESIIGIWQALISRKKIFWVGTMKMITAVDARRNHLLAELPDRLLNEWLPCFENMELAAGKVIYEVGESLDHVYFPTDAVVSFVLSLEDGSVIEMAMIGSDGMVGVSAVLGSRTASGSAVVLVKGNSLRLSTDKILQNLANGSVVQTLLFRFTQALVAQIVQTSACSRRHSLEQQFCRWLLMVQDRLPSGDLKLTHESIASMLGVRRESVTEVAIRLQAADIIRYTRGRIVIRDRGRLELRACECYKFINRHYASLFPPR